MSILKQDSDYHVFKLDDFSIHQESMVNYISRYQLTYGLNEQDEWSNTRGWHSEGFHMEDGMEVTKIFSPLTNKINDLVSKHFSFRKSIPQHKIKTLYWFIVNYKNDSNTIHNHMPRDPGTAYNIGDAAVTLLSGVFYLKAPQNCGNLFFASQCNYMTPYVTNNHDRVYEPVEGEGVVFYPHLKHGVLPNQTNEERIITSFNVCLYPDFM